jgi:imidazolonepropionase-like amidohydrolase
MLRNPEFAARVTEHIQARYREMHQIHIANVSLARRLGVRVAMGSDVGTPGNHCGENAQEFEVMVHEASFSPLEAIQAGTINAATLMRLDDQVGTLEEGKLADLIVVGANPLEDVSALCSVSLVMKEGRIVKDERGRTAPDAGTPSKL